MLAYIILVLYILKSLYILRDILAYIIRDIRDVARLRVQKRTFVRVFGVIVRLIVLIVIVSPMVGGTPI